MKLLIFSTHSMKYICYSPQKSKYPLFISAFNYICLMGCSPQEMSRCWHVGSLGKLSPFALQTENFTSIFYGDSFRFLLQNFYFRILCLMKDLQTVWA